MFMLWRHVQVGTFFAVWLYSMLSAIMGHSIGAKASPAGIFCLHCKDKKDKKDKKIIGNFSIFDNSLVRIKKILYLCTLKLYTS